MPIICDPHTPFVSGQINRLSKEIQANLDSLLSNTSVMEFKTASFHSLYPSIYATMLHACKEGMNDVGINTQIPRLDNYAKTLADTTVGFISTDSEAALNASQITKKNLASKDRANLIAEDNLFQAYYVGRRIGWSTDKTARKSWYVHDSHDRDDVCDDNEEAGDIPINAVFPSGHQQPKAHFGCNCYLVLVQKKSRKYSIS